MASNKKTVRTLDERLKIIKEVENSPGETRVIIAKRLGLATSTLNSIFKDRDKIRDEITKCGSTSKIRKTSRESPFQEMETLLMQWFRQARANNLVVSGPVIREKATQISDRLGIKNFAASNGWIDRFRQRHDLAYRQVSGESAAVNNQTTEFWKSETLPELIRNYELKDIFNADETGLFYNLMPDKTWTYRGESCHGGKLSKARLTVLLTCNADGSEMLQPLVIGKSKKPRGFKATRKLPVQYLANKKAWMTGALFTDYLKAFDAKMGAKKRKVLMFIDNCPAHPPDVRLQNVTLAFFPPNCTSHLQPLDMGVIRCLKSHYRKALVRKALALMEAGSDPAKMKVDVLHAVHYVASAWKKVTPVCISNCFRKAGFVKADVVIDNEDDEIEIVEDEHDTADWAAITANINLSFEDYVNIDDTIATSGTLTVDEIVDANLADSEPEEEVEEEEEPTPAFNDVIQAFETLKLFVYRQDIDDGEMASIANLEHSLCRFRHQRKQTQQNITSFFTPLGK